MPSPTSPSDDELLKAAADLRATEPYLGRAKFLSHLKETNSWILSDARLKKCLHSNDLNAHPRNVPLDGGLPRDTAFQGIIKAAYKDYKLREREFLLGLDKSGFPRPVDAALHQRYYIHVLLTLKEVTACCVMVNAVYPSVDADLVQYCLKPVVEKYQLARYGFALRQIQCSAPLVIGGVLHQNLQHDWILADMRSPSWSEIKDMFLVALPGIAASHFVNRLAGFTDGSGTAKFRINDRAELAGLQDIVVDMELCCVMTHADLCDPPSTQFKEIMDTFTRYREVGLEVGADLRLEVSGYPQMVGWLKGMRGLGAYAGIDDLMDDHKPYSTAKSRAALTVRGEKLAKKKLAKEEDAKGKGAIGEEANEKKEKIETHESQI